MQGFDSKFIEELKLKSDIVEVVGRYVHLEQKGSTYWGNCPFHHEKTPSFAVNARGQFYYCFGCHKSGDVISFISEIESLDFSDAVKFLAERAHMPLPTVNIDDQKVKEQKKKKETLLSILKDTAYFYVHNLKDPKASPHLDYIAKRKFTKETVVKFGMGASLDFNGLPDFLKSKGYSYEDMVASGVCGKSDKTGRVYDWLGGRLIIPVIDQFNNVIAFDGRRIDGVNEQKYINTKETYVFSKGKTLFNLNNLKKAKNDRGIDSVIIVEGHLDIVSLVQAGINNVVASMGTALTKDQARIIKRYADVVYVSYDGDSAGQKATLRGLDILQEEGLDVKVVSLPNGMDPDDVIKNYGEKGYRNLLLESKPLIDYKISVLKNSFNFEEIGAKRKYAKNAIKIVRESSSPAEQEELLKEIRDITGITLDALKRELYSENEETEEVVSHEYNEESGDKIAVASRFILCSYLFNKPFAGETDIGDIVFTNPVHIKIKDYILARVKENKKPNFSDLYEECEGGEVEELSKIAELETSENKQFDQSLYFNDCIKALELNEIENKIAMLTSQYKTETDIETRHKIAQEMNSYFARKNKLK